MQENNSTMIVSQNSFSHVFNLSLDLLYSIFISPKFLPYVFFNKSELLSMKKNTDMADEGNEITLRIINQYTFTFKVEKTINKKNFKSFTHRCISSSAMFASFIVTFNFFWNSIDKNTLFEIDISITDSLYKNSILNYVQAHQNKMFKNLEEYFENNISNLEQKESISFNCDIDTIWNYFKNFEHLKIFFGGIDKIAKIKIKQDESNNNQYIVDDENVNNCLTLQIEFLEETDSKKEINISIIKSNIQIPKQKINLRILKIFEEKTFIIFTHIILQYIDNDILESYSTLKQKILWNIKKEIEK